MSGNGEPPAGLACHGCQHLLPRGTCAEPVAAGLLSATEGFGIVWPQPGHDATCPAFTKRTLPLGRPYRLTRSQADAAHREPWGSDQIDLYRARTKRLRRMGFNAHDAEDLAELLHLRDTGGDDRLMCVECRHFEAWRCANHQAAGLAEPTLPRQIVPLLQRCPGGAAAPMKADDERLP